jgi:hypothetical protein
MKRFAVLAIGLTLALSGCVAQTLERDFFGGEITTRNQRLATYSLDEQWHIFLYGNQVIHPPATGLAQVLARQGETALRFILGKLESSRNDLDYRDSMVVFQMMQWHGDYAICANGEVMSKIKGNQSKIENPAWRQVYGEMLAELCRAK